MKGEGIAIMYFRCHRIIWPFSLPNSGSCGEGPYFKSREQPAVGHEQRTSAHGTRILEYSIEDSLDS